MGLAIGLSVGLVTSVIACAAAIGLLRRLGVMDVPNYRSSHRRPVVRGAGIGVACGAVVGLLAVGVSDGGAGWPWRAASVLIVASLSAGVIGLVDDLRGGISFRVRLAAQVLVASASVVTLNFEDLAMPWRMLLLCASAVWVVGYLNAFNFMDGINGIAAASAIVAGAMFAVVGRLEGLPLLEAGGATLAAACIGFAPFNLPDPLAFLGDVGSYFIGAWIALVAYVAARAGIRLDVVAAPLALYMADVGITLTTRLRRGEQWHAAHRDHAYQRLASGRLGHAGTTLVVLAATTGLSALGLVALRAPTWRPMAWLAAAVLLVAYLGAPSLLRRRHDHAR